MKRWVEGLLNVNGTVCIKIEYAFLQMMKGFVKAETGMAGGKSGNKDVEVHGWETVVDHLAVMDFDSVKALT